MDEEIGPMIMYWSLDYIRDYAFEGLEEEDNQCLRRFRRELKSKTIACRVYHISPVRTLVHICNHVLLINTDSERSRGRVVAIWSDKHS